MNGRVNKTILSLLFLGAFLFLRVANAHAFSHLGEDSGHEHCELCDIIITSQEITPFSGDLSSETETQEFVLINKEELNSEYDAPLHCIASPVAVYNKPPPSK